MYSYPTGESLDGLITHSGDHHDGNGHPRLEVFAGSKPYHY